MLFYIILFAKNVEFGIDIDQKKCIIVTRNGVSL